MSCLHKKNRTEQRNHQGYSQCWPSWGGWNRELLILLSTGVLLLGLQWIMVTQGKDEVPAIKCGIDKAIGLVDDDLAVTPMLDCQRFVACVSIICIADSRFCWGWIWLAVCSDVVWKAQWMCGVSPAPCNNLQPWTYFATATRWTCLLSLQWLLLKSCTGVRVLHFWSVIHGFWKAT